MKKTISLFSICVIFFSATPFLTNPKLVSNFVSGGNNYVDNTVPKVTEKKDSTIQLWKAAVAKVKITPEHAKGSWMFGNATQTKPSTGVAHDIFAVALAIEDYKGTKLVIVTYDLQGIPRTLRQSLVKRCEAAYKLAPASILLNASHTHSGPEVRLNGINGDDCEAYIKDKVAAEAYGRKLEEKTFKLIGEVLRNLAPAKLDYFHARAGFAMSRRLPTENGCDFGPNSNEPVDHSVPVLRVTSPDGRQLRALLFGYACHPTALVNSTMISPDYVGYARDYIEEAHPGTIALFMQGCAGDQNPYPRHTPEFVKYHGRSLANAVEAALLTIPVPVNGTLGVAFSEVALEYAPLPSREELQNRKNNSDDKWERGHAEWVLGLMDHNQVPVSYPCPVQVVRFGNDLALAAIGGEPVVDYSFRLKHELAYPNVWVAGYSNDIFGYIGSSRVLKEGGYEGGGFIVYGRTNPNAWAASTEDRIVSKILELDNLLKRSGDTVGH